ncbi:zinc finger protein 532 [Platysternon megacephalum]|uniref:Zinc finger protein 532 n=1 Tax=Platysternon megacephalum TaxID=55544 RepID=A0A4D9EL67_9SAUR|nr:zinc finger protein 532 [Platysternon megacephalum]
MAHSSWLLWLFLCCVAGQATPGEQREPVGEALGYGRTRPRPNLQDQAVALGQRAVLWLVSIVGLYGLTSLLDDFPDKQKNEVRAQQAGLAQSHPASIIGMSRGPIRDLAPLWCAHY